MVKRLDKKGQSWTWTYISSGFSLLVISFFFIILNEIIDKTEPLIVATGGNEVNIATMTSLWFFVPVLFLFSYAMLNWIRAAATRGGEI